MACSLCYSEGRKEIGNLCPLDGEKIDDESTFTRKDRYFAREISKIKVKCYYENCKWEGALNDINVRTIFYFIANLNTCYRKFCLPLKRR